MLAIKTLFKSLASQRKLSFFNEGLHAQLIVNQKDYISIDINIYEDKNYLSVYFSDNHFSKNHFNFKYYLDDMCNFNSEEFLKFTYNLLKEDSSQSCYQKLLTYIFEPSKDYEKLSSLKLHKGKLYYILLEEDMDFFEYHKLNKY